MVEVQDLQKRFGRITAVAGVSFTAPDGKITGLLGENGAGKTTTLAMMCGLVPPDNGSIRVDDAVGMPVDLRRRVGALLDHKGLYPRLTARENVAYFGALRGIEGPALDRRVQDTVTLLDMEPIADRRTAGFSQGERMKVALARAIIHSPRNLLLDEPTNGLDIPSARSLRAALIRMRERGTCIVLSSHVLQDVEALCDDIVLMSRGRVVLQGSSAAVCGQAGCPTLEDAFMRLTKPEETPTCLTA